MALLIEPSRAMADRHEQGLIELARSTAWFCDALESARALQLDDWCIGAGAVRNLVWDALLRKATPSPLADIDVAYFDEADTSAARDERLTQRLRQLRPGVPWEVTNQAGVHEWFEGRFGHPVAPLRSLVEAVSTWPEYATSVGLTMDRDGSIRVIAPHGLDDLFAMVIRRNPTRVSVDTYRARIAAKRHVERWPGVTVVEC